MDTRASSLGDATFGDLSQSESELHALLTSHGYVWSTRESGWFECLVANDRERWRGQGLTTKAALLDALHQMLPSALARRAFTKPALFTPSAASEPLAETLVSPSVAPQAVVPVMTVTSPPTVTPLPVTVRGPEIAGEVTVLEAPSVVTSTVVPATATPVASLSPVSPAAPVVPTEAVSESRLKRFPGPPPLAIRRSDEDVAELEVLDERLRVLLPELAGFSRDLQRLGFIAFIARARHVSQRTSDPRVEQVVRRIAGRLGELASQFWPGSVRALQLRATPLQAGADMELPDGGRLHDWAEAAEVAERLIEEKRLTLDKRGLDEAGWADHDRCMPAPNDPEARLEVLRHAMEKFFGRLDFPSSSDTDRELQQNADKSVAELVKWAKELRWLRPHVEDRVRWGQAVGRLRWAVTRIPREHRSALDLALDEQHRPTKPWAHELGEDPVAKQKKKLRKALLQKKPEGDKATPDAVSKWLAEAFELGDGFSTAEIAERIPDWNATVLALPADESTDKDRKYRRRLKLLQDEIERRERGETPGDIVQGDVDPEEAAPLEPDEGDISFRKLLARVRERIEGKSALFVSNRADPLLKERLERELGVQIDWAEIDPRRIQSRIESVRRMSYDLVMSATGFQGHSIDATLGRETKACGLPYVRVNRGRLTTCVRALARQFGLLEAA